jgi:RND family efflux transporter MFP subunit
MENEPPMRYFITFSINFVLLIALSLALPGCVQAPAVTATAQRVQVEVSLPVEREVTDYADFTGRTAAVDSVEVRARVGGYLDKVNFKEGTLVNKGDVLFEIDPRTYEATHASAKAELERQKAQLTLDANLLRRAEALFGRGALSPEEHDRAVAQHSGSRAGLAAAEARVQQSELDLAFTKVTAPVSGRISRYNVTVGNLVQPGEQNGGTMLTTIVSVDPMYAYFDVDEHTELDVRRLVREGKAKSTRDVAVPVWLGLADEASYPHRGTINFTDNQVNPKTGTIKCRGVFPNKDEALSPGMFVRVRMPLGEPHRALLVVDRALETDQGQKILDVVNDKNEVVVRRVRVGSLHENLRVIEEGLKPGERVVVNGLQQIRPGAAVETKLVGMPGSIAGNFNGKARVATVAP